MKKHKKCPCCACETDLPEGWWNVIAVLSRCLAIQAVAFYPWLDTEKFVVFCDEHSDSYVYESVLIAEKYTDYQIDVLATQGRNISEVIPDGALILYAINRRNIKRRHK